VTEDSRVLRMRRLCCRPPIASAPSSSSPERQALDNMTSYCLGLVVPEGMSQVTRRSEVCNVSSAFSMPGYLLALLQELSHVPRVLTEVIEPKQVQTRIEYVFGTRSKRMYRELVITFRTKNLVYFVFWRFRSALNTLVLAFTLAHTHTHTWMMMRVPC